MDDGKYKEGILNKKFRESEWKPQLIKYLKGKSKDEYTRLLTLFHLWDNKGTKTSYKNINNFEIEKSKLASGFVRAVMKKTFNIGFIQSHCKNYMLFDNTYWDNICEKNETFLTKTLKFIEDDRLIDFLD